MTILTGAQGATSTAPYGQVYLIENLVNGKRYVGQTTVGLDSRWKRHVQSSRSGGRTQPITSALRKYGLDAFTMTEVRRCRDQDELNRAEYEEVIRLNTFAPAGYNLRAGGGGYGRTSPELRARLSLDFTDARKQALSAMYTGRRLSDLAYERVAEANAVTVRIYDRYGDLKTIKNVSRFLGTGGDLPSEGNFFNAAHGKRVSARGWTVLPSGPLVGGVSRGPLGLTCDTCSAALVGFTAKGAQKQHANKCRTHRALLEAASALGNLTPLAYATRLALFEGAGRLVEKASDRPSPARLVAADGEFRDVTFPLNAFCEANDLRYIALWKLMAGHIGSHRGWRLAPIPPLVTTP